MANLYRTRKAWSSPGPEEAAREADRLAEIAEKFLPNTAAWVVVTDAFGKVVAERSIGRKLSG